MGNSSTRSAFLCSRFPAGDAPQYLDDDLRRDLYRQITANPGIGTTKLGSDGCITRRLRYHLDMLIREGKVAAVSYRNRARHFAGNQRYTVSKNASLPASG